MAFVRQMAGDFPISFRAAVCRSLQAFAALKGQEKGNESDSTGWRRDMPDIENAQAP